METQFSLGSVDNKGILSLLSAIEQTGDNFETDPESPEPIKDEICEQVHQFNPIEGLEMNNDIDFSINKSFSICLICGKGSFSEPNDSTTMIDIYLEISGRKLSQRIEDIVSRKIIPNKHSSLICNECFALMQQIEYLETELLQHKRTITSKFAASNPVKTRKVSPKKTSFTTLAESKQIPSICEPLDYSEPIIDPKMPLQFLANEKDIEKDLEQLQDKHPEKKTKLELLAETLRDIDENISSEDENYFQMNNSSDCKKFRSLNCHVCTKTFKNKSMYERHIKSHEKEKTFKCSDCKKVFTSKTSFQVHQKLHSDTRTYSCPHCSKDFKGKKSLIEHVSAKHSMEKKYACCQCPESFVSRHLKNVHERSHTGERGFICDQCGENFATSQGLSHHKSKHTGDYQYRCRACDKGFNNYKLMEEHFHIHTGSKPYECNKCDKSFANRGSLWIHMKQHEKLKPYVCNQCNHLAVAVQKNS